VICSLQGYTFEAEASGQSFTVKVPVGGVEEGQKFSVPFLAGSNGNSGAAIPRASIPEGRWRDDCCDCFRHGVCHPMLWNAWCCPLILVGQTMQRLNLTWLGNEVGTSLDPSVVVGRVGTFRIMLWITVVYYIASVVLYFLVPVRCLLALSFGLFSIVLVCKTRKHIREKYRIPEKQCHGCEDCCCAYWCGCCTVAQMARHTADYETYPGLCCSETGVSPHAPSIV
ncbi:hypothetical protein ACHAXR_009171, partial [Thalassiosira sp. AJA248-18]